MIKRIVLAEIYGILIISLSYLLLVYSSFSFLPSNVFTGWILYLLRLFILALGGFVVGFLVKNKGWLWGGVCGAFFGLAYLIALSVTLEKITFLNGLNVVFSNLPTIFLTGLGGFIGEKFTKLKSNKK